MKSAILFVAASLMLIAAMLAVALPNIVQADKPNGKWYDEGTPFCAEKKPACKELIVGIETKCDKVEQP